MKYKSCIWLNQGINFDRNTYKLCCLYSGAGGGNTIVKHNYKGEAVDWKNFFNKKKEIRELHKNGGTYHKCEGCVFLEEKEWDESEDYINFINLDYWTKCNCHCSYCETSKDKGYYNSLVTYNFLPVLKDMIAKNVIKFNGNGHVSFGGGEVTLLEEFEEILDIFVEKNIGFIRIHSACMSYSPAIERGLQKGCLDLIVSVDSGSKEMHRKIKQVDTYDQVWGNLQEYATHQANPELVKTKYIIIPGVNDSKDEIIKWLDKSKEIGVKYVINEIESEWFYSTRPNIPEYIYELFDFAREEAIKRELVQGWYERAAHMMSERPTVK